MQRRVGAEGTPVAAVVGREVGAVGADRDPAIARSVISHGRAEAVGWGGGGLPGHANVRAEGSRARRVVGLLRVPANGHSDRIVLECDGEDTRGRIVPREWNTDLVPVGQLIVWVYIGVLVNKVVEECAAGAAGSEPHLGLGIGMDVLL